jgi:hypothetical protein
VPRAATSWSTRTLACCAVGESGVLAHTQPTRPRERDPHIKMFLHYTQAKLARVTDPYPGSGAFLPPGYGSGMIFFRIPDPAPFLAKLSYIIFRILVMLSLRSWATPKTYF